MTDSSSSKKSIRVARRKLRACVAPFDLVCKGLHVTRLVRLFEGGHGVTLRRKFLAYIAVVVGGGDGAADGGVVEFLIVVEFVAARIARRVEVADVGDVVAQGADDVAFTL